jgi:hypothetical protein
MAVAVESRNQRYKWWHLDQQVDTAFFAGRNQKKYRRRMKTLSEFKTCWNCKLIFVYGAGANGLDV